MAVPVALLCATAPELQGTVLRPDPAAAAAAGTSSIPSSSSSSSSSSEAGQLVLQAQQGSSSNGDAAALTLPQEPQDQAQLQQQQQQQQGELLPLNRDLLVLSLGLGALLFVPLFKQFTNLPPYMGMLSGLGVLWMVTDALHFGENKAFPRVQDALRNLDIAGANSRLNALQQQQQQQAGQRCRCMLHTTCCHAAGRSYCLCMMMPECVLIQAAAYSNSTCRAWCVVWRTSDLLHSSLWVLIASFGHSCILCWAGSVLFTSACVMCLLPFQVLCSSWVSSCQWRHSMQLGC
jgi:hypothetical protein